MGRTTSTYYRHICLIDDDEIVLLMVSNMLNRLLGNEFRFSSFLNGQLALDAFRQFKPEDFPDLILLDLKMPVMDGFEFLSYYQREFLNPHPDSHLFVLTSSLLSQDRDDCLRFGFVRDYMIKPLLLTQLQELGFLLPATPKAMSMCLF